MFFCLKNITSFLFATTISVTAEDFIYDGIAYRILPDEPATVEVTRNEGITYSGSIATLVLRSMSDICRIGRGH